MAAEIPTPICDVTRLPLPILPTEPDTRARFLFEDFHHHFHPRLSPELSDLAGRALRYSRGQDIVRELHNRYHALFLGPQLPTNEEDKFRLTVLACAGVMPREAIDLSRSGHYRKVVLSEEEYAWFGESRSIHIDRAYKPDHGYYKRRAIGRFFAAYALKQNVREVVSDRVVGEFTDDKTNPERKKELGNLILREALGMSIDGILPLHRDLKAEGYILPGKVMGLPELLSKFFRRQYYPDYYSEMARLLGAGNTLQTEVNELELAS